MIDFLEESKVRYIFNVPYSPQFNPIETVFAKVKSIFKRSKLYAVSNNRRFHQETEIKNAFGKVKIADVVGYIKLSFAHIYNL